MLDISVIIPVYNAGRFLEKAVQSAVHFEEVKEIILVEDKSTDNSLEICKKLADGNSKIKLFQHPDQENHGAGATRNLGIEKATGSFITFLDADDYYLPNRFNAEKEIFEDPKIDGVFSAIGVEYLTEKGKQEYLTKFKDSPLTTVNYPAEGEEVFRGLLSLTPKTFGTFFHLNALTVRKSAIDKHNLRFNVNLRVHQDSDFNIKLAYHCYLKSGIIDQPVAIRGIHDDNRITKIVQYSPQYNQRQYIYWKSLYDWASSQNIPEEYKKRVYLSYKSFDLSQKKGLIKYLNIIVEGLKNPDILKTKYRFNYYR
ncbi:Glycosyltransferase involved in cell wall bisynthesis [Chryseobacterium soldanellicola]|uniref:Glycosyltransferase involved in cell wall bisynthesis n=1 Tax=Chryseobacterium soldanellicola TaxID=311333 RepID=A0A1H1A7I3_9FLAO|nr:glycosyltransferase family 2 protein [Chryseobacterium soldanellicola]SDQ35604.1 Glycosyltransferase involved in cell wall bisynthesis [Chryseobacterium soldanellicola]